MELYLRRRINLKWWDTELQGMWTWIINFTNLDIHFLFSSVWHLKMEIMSYVKSRIGYMKTILEDDQSSMRLLYEDAFGLLCNKMPWSLQKSVITAKDSNYTQATSREAKSSSHSLAICPMENWSNYSSSKRKRVRFSIVTIDYFIIGKG